MPPKPVRVIIDTNLWVSFLLKRDLKTIDINVKAGNVTLLLSKELLEELLDVIYRPKFKKYFLNNIIKQLLHLFDKYAEYITVSSKIQICRDPNDDFLLSLAIDSSADYLITGDKDLLVLKSIHQTKIITITEFLETL